MTCKPQSPFPRKSSVRRHKLTCQSAPGSLPGQSKLACSLVVLGHVWTQSWFLELEGFGALWACLRGSDDMFQPYCSRQALLPVPTGLLQTKKHVMRLFLGCPQKLLSRPGSLATGDDLGVAFTGWGHCGKRGCLGVDRRAWAAAML